MDFRSDSEIAEAEPYASPGARLVSIKMQDPAGVPKRWGRRAGVPHPLAWAQVGKPPASLRSKGGKPRKPSPLQLAFEQNDFTAVPELARNGMPQVYNWLVTDTHRKADFAQFLAEACEPANLPLAFMCNAGKDRTAVGALLLLTALDVPDHAIMEDYMLTNSAFGRPGGVERDVRKQVEMMAERWSPTRDLSAYSEEDVTTVTRALATITGADEANLREAVRVMEEEAGSVLEFMRRELGFTDAMGQALRAAVLEPVPAGKL